MNVSIGLTINGERREIVGAMQASTVHEEGGRARDAAGVRALHVGGDRC